MYISFRISISPEIIIESMGEKHIVYANSNQIFVSLSSDKARELSCLRKALNAVNISYSIGKIKTYYGKKNQAIFVQREKFEKAFPSIFSGNYQYAYVA